MLVWMFYAIVVSLFLSGAAFCAERASRIRPDTSRWVWLMTILASLLLPVLISSVVIQLPSIASPTTIERVIPLNSVTSSTLSPVRWIASTGNDVKALSDFDPLLVKTWLAVSFLLALGLSISALSLMWRKGTWRSETFNGVDVYVSRDAGPAIVGLLQPRIVIPEWIVRAPASQQTLVLAHEQSHLDAGDQKLLTVSLCLLIFMPWNLPLWWQLQRLRRAIEVDCDARVLKHGYSVSTYGEALIEVGQRQSTFIGAVAAMSESISFLEQRLTIMTNSPTKLWKMSVAVFAVLSIGLLTAATQISPPNTGSDPSAHQEFRLPVSILNRYVGFYKLNQSTVLTITRNEQQLYIQVTGQPAFEIYPESETTFFLKVVEASINFVSDGKAPATSLVMHQNGVHNALRIDTATAEKINTGLSARIQAKGTSSAVKWLQIIDSGDYEESWNQADPFFQKQLSSKQWEKALKQVRTPLGKLVSRQVKNSSPHTSSPGAPDGEYLVVTLTTHYEHKKSATETVTVRKVGSEWRGVGYFIK